MEEALIKRVQPHSAEAEQSVIGAMLMDREAIIIASEMLTKDDFYQPQLGVVFGGILVISYYLLSLGLTNQQNSFGLLFSGIGLCVLVIGSTWGAYAFVMLAALELPVGTLLRNAWYLMVLSGRYTFAVMATLVFSTVILLALFPMSLALVAFGWLAVTQYTVCWFVYQPVEDRIIRPFEKQNAEREEETV